MHELEPRFLDAWPSVDVESQASLELGLAIDLREHRMVDSPIDHQDLHLAKHIPFSK